MNKNEEAKSYLEKMINNSDTPGLQYMISNINSTIFEFNDGYANLENKKKVSAKTTFSAFSVTKTFTALAILQLEEYGKLNIDDNVKTYLSFLPYKMNISIRQLLNHTSGLPNPMPLNWIHLLNEDDSFNYEIFVKNIINNNDGLDNNPGEKYSYSNIGYLLLGEIIKKVSGEDYRTYVKNNIIKKLSLNNEAYLDFTISDTLNHAHGYIKKWSLLNFGLNFVFDKNKYMEDTYDGWNQFKYFYINGYSYGGLIGNARGFAKYLHALLIDNLLINNDERIKLFEIQRTNDGKTIKPCLSWFHGKLDNDNYYTHSGGGGGYYSEIRIYPEKKIISVIMFNRTGVSEERILDSIDKFFL